MLEAHPAFVLPDVMSSYGTCVKKFVKDISQLCVINNVWHRGKSVRNTVKYFYWLKQSPKTTKWGATVTIGNNTAETIVQKWGIATEVKQCAFYFYKNCIARVVSIKFMQLASVLLTVFE